jgi:multiple sugar transport system ATP-binding protein
VFSGRLLENGDLFIGEDQVLSVKAENTAKEILVGVRPEGFVPAQDGALCCNLRGVEVMGRDISILSENEALEGNLVRSVVSAEMQKGVDLASKTVRFSLKPQKIFLFEKESGKRIPFSVK